VTASLRLVWSVTILAIVGIVGTANIAYGARVVCRPGLKSVPLTTDAVDFQISPCGGGLQSVRLKGEQFELGNAPVNKLIPKWAQDKWRPGALQMVETWDAKWDPFRDVLTDVKLQESLEVGVRPSEDATLTVSRVSDVNAWAQREIRWGLVSHDDSQVTLVWPDPALVKTSIYVVKNYRKVEEKPRSLSVTITVWNLGSSLVNYKLEHVVSTFSDPTKDSGGFFAMLAGPPDEKGAAFMREDEVMHMTQKELIDAIEDGDLSELSSVGAPKWLGTDSRYFLLATRPLKGWGTSAGAQLVGLGNGVVQAKLRSGGEALAAATGSCKPSWYAKHWGGADCRADLKTLAMEQAQDVSIAPAFFDAARLKADPAKVTQTEAAIERLRNRRFKQLEIEIYAGPKQIDYLKDAGQSLDSAIDFGWFGAIGRPLLSIMRYAHKTTGSWPLAIILLTLMVKGLFWPIMSKSMRSMRKMQTLKPELDRVRAKLEKDAKAKGLDKADPQELNQQTFALYKRHGVNPLGGCLPMFLQMPVYIALYRTIYSSVELYNQPLFGWIGDLTQKDPYYVLPIVLGAMMFAQQKLMPSPGADASTQKMMTYFLPGMFAVMMMQLPSGLVLYILVNTVLSIVQNIWLRREEKQA